MAAVEIDASLIRALQKRARKERTSVERLATRLLGGALQELEDYEAVKQFRIRAARGAGKTKRGLRLLAKARGERKPRRS